MSPRKERLTKPERKLLRSFVVHRSVLVVRRNGKAFWDNDSIDPCNAVATLAKLASKGLIDSHAYLLGETEYRRLPKAELYVCRANGCRGGSIFEEGDDGYDHEVRKCSSCEGTGISLHPWKATQ